MAVEGVQSTESQTGGAKPNGTGPAGGEPDYGTLTREEATKLLQEARESEATLRRTVLNREEEAKRVHAKYERALAEFGDEKAREEFTHWRENRQKEEEERLRKEGQLEKINATLEQRVKEQEAETQRLKGEMFRAEIHRELAREANRLEAVNIQQVLKFFGDPTDWVRNDKGDLVHKTATAESTGAPLTPRTLLERERAGDNANLFRSALKSGSGAAAGGTGSNGSNAATTIRFFRGRVVPEDQAKYEAATAEAKKTGRPANIKFEHVDSL